MEKIAFIVKLGNSAPTIHDVFVVIAGSADGACAKLKKSVNLDDYADNTVIVAVEAISGTVLE